MKSIADLEITEALLQKYNQSGPRYTSYPTVPNWDQGVFSQEYLTYLEREGRTDKPISMYLHLPFCSRLCTFCGCHKFITQKADIVEEYITALFQEIEQVSSVLKTRKVIQQFHLGGGTPTHMTPEQLERIFYKVQEHFDFHPDAEIALEAHPRVTTREHLERLYALGFRRISFGVQDTDDAVQKAINRNQTLEQTQQTHRDARDIGYTGINIDLVYGLPQQTPETFKKTIDDIYALGPDRLAVYSFAYIPNMFKTHERAIKEEDLPSTKEKLEIYMEGIRRFTSLGYAMIGMDHYATPQDELTLAQEQKTLHRNFMGYTTHKGLSMLGLGVSAISDFGDGYFQNEKDLQHYIKGSQQGHLPKIRKMELSRDDVIRREVIERLMCHGELDRKEIESQFEIQFDSYFEDALVAMQHFETEKLISFEGSNIILEPLGILFMRNVMMPFDAYLSKQAQGTHFSKTI